MLFAAALALSATTGAGQVKTLTGEFEGLRRLRVGNYRVLFDETGEVITGHHIRYRRRPIVNQPKVRCRRGPEWYRQTPALTLTLQLPYTCQ